MAESSEKGKQLPLPEAKPNLPHSKFMTVIRGDKKIRTQILKTDNPNDPIEARSVKSGNRIDLDSSEQEIAYSLFDPYRSRD